MGIGNVDRSDRRVTKRLTVIDDEIRAKVAEVLERTPYYAGPETAAFEREVAAYCDTAHGVAANSGTSCLLIALLACGVGRGDEVIVPANTFVSVPEAVRFVGATPVLVDVEPDANLSAEIVERHLTPKTRAVVPVHMFGHPVDMDPLMDLARRHELWVVEDAAHALGARYKGRRVGAFGHVGFFSFAGKSITVCGQAGMAVTGDDDLAEKMSTLRVHGWRQERGNVWHVAERLGLNLRTSEILSAIGRVNLARLDEWTRARTRNGEALGRLLGALGAPVTLPTTRPDQEPGWLHYVVRAPERDALRRHLSHHGVETGVHYSVPLHRQPAFESFVSDVEAYPVTDALCGEILTLPSHPWMSEEDVAYVAETVAGFYAGR